MTGIPLTRAQVRELDRLAIEEYGIPGVVLMENAGRGAAEHILVLLTDRRARGLSAEKVAILCGAGNNGGDGAVVARHLSNAAIDVEVFATEATGDLCGDALLQRRVIERMGLAVHDVSNRVALESVRARIESADVLVDALLGTGFTGQVRPKIAQVIAAIDHARRARRARPTDRASVVALDLPSGLDCDSGEPSNATVNADLTLTFVARKAGFDATSALPFLGRIEVVDIGAPAELTDRVRRLSRSSPG